MTRWNRLLVAGAALALVGAPAAAGAKKRPRTSAEARKQPQSEKPAPPNDPRTNVGAQGRINATDEAARSADSAQQGNTRDPFTSPAW